MATKHRRDPESSLKLGYTTTHFDCGKVGLKCCYDLDAGLTAPGSSCC